MKQSELFPKLERERKLNDISQTEMAKRLGVSQVQYNKWCNDKGTPGSFMMERIFSYLKNDPDEIVIVNRHKEGKEPEYYTLREINDYGEDTYSKHKNTWRKMIREK